jgi:Gpi18-like mannosyltransferase
MLGQQMIQSSVRPALKAWWGRCVVLWAALAIGLSLAGWLGTQTLELSSGYDPVVELRADSWPGLWARWDAPYYFHIARDGYGARPYTMGYFPLYPLLIAGLARVTGLHLVTAGVVIAQLGHLAALLIFYKLARLLRDEHAFALRAVVALALFPTAFFFMAMYAESLALALGLLSVYCARRGRWVWSGLALGLASAARPVGWLLGIILVIEFVRRRQFHWRALAQMSAALALAASGTVLYVVYLYLLTGKLNAIREAQDLWLMQWQYPWVTLGKGVWIAFMGNGVENDWFLYVSNWADLLFTLLAIGLTLIGARRLPLSFTVYMVVSILFILTRQGLEMVPLWGRARWVVPLFPMYFVIADLLKTRRVFWPAMAVSALMMAALAAWWASGRWVG